jgi:hypothetical protein
LLYINPYESREIQYKKSIGILNDIYTKRGSDGIPDTYRVHSVDAGVKNASQAIDEIWDHIKFYKQPVVVVVDSNIMEYMTKNPVPPSVRGVPTLHYIVIIGMRESQSSFIKYFSIYDPDTPGIVEYTSTQFKGLITMPANTPEWVYNYPKNDLWIYEPCYRLLIFGT